MGIREATPVPIPNTVVKLSEPMIVYTNAKVGIAGLYLGSIKRCFRPDKPVAESSIYK